ncbi:MAG: hypothetical protein QXJ96_03270 [Candidatus Aenigmatarchaeota archaeon]|nr:hypothetical protein [Candidatus Aenigmarchaeota archaeon]
MKRPNWKVWLENRKECKKWNNFYLQKKILRKQSLKPKDYFIKALHNLDFANWIYEKHKNEIKNLFGEQRFFDWVIVIYYYAIYHAALALIASKNLFSKSHLATLNALILYFYHEKKIEKEDVEIVIESISKVLEREDIETIVETKELRERASYGASYEFEESLVETAKSNAIKFIEKVRSILEI